ncbi:MULTISPECIES: acyl-CoA thioesterase [Pontibacillus]|uniref:Thioesterase family protein n=1 Tax=Pontibacillus chungwhensis TaxID=265426 RepID=A0ABY8USX4_9BACI|nr:MULTISPECIES: thioesterase family protein [Pontibacillus]MCD5323217.1 acyl-CoA thioesterase [Pontibacillus sp. HN14]WIF96604.1 thioesterase family protein [Pontibacillus chungwhensis]
MHQHKVIVRFCETDLLGHVNNSNYFVYFEDARIQFFYDAAIFNNDQNYVLASAKCDFIKQAYFRQVLVIETKITRIGNSSFTAQQEIYDDETKELIARGETVIVSFNVETEKSHPLSNSIREKLAHYIVND